MSRLTHPRSLLTHSRKIYPAWGRVDSSILSLISLSWNCLKEASDQAKLTAGVLILLRGTVRATDTYRTKLSPAFPVLGELAREGSPLLPI
jgi:hypothetical protein